MTTSKAIKITKDCIAIAGTISESVENGLVVINDPPKDLIESQIVVIFLV